MKGVITFKYHRKRGSCFQIYCTYSTLKCYKVLPSCYAAQQASMWAFMVQLFQNVIAIATVGICCY